MGQARSRAEQFPARCRPRCAAWAANPRDNGARDNGARDNFRDELSLAPGPWSPFTDKHRGPLKALRLVPSKGWEIFESWVSRIPCPRCGWESECAAPILRRSIELRKGTADVTTACHTDWHRGMPIAVRPAPSSSFEKSEEWMSWIPTNARQDSECPESPPELPRPSGAAHNTRAPKGQFTTAQGNALGTAKDRPKALKGRFKTDERAWSAVQIMPHRPPSRFAEDSQRRRAQ